MLSRFLDMAIVAIAIILAPAVGAQSTTYLDVPRVCNTARTSCTTASPTVAVGTDGSPVAVNGANTTQTIEEAKVLAGQGYTVSTTIVGVASGNYLNATLTNPAGSGVNYVFTSRILACNTAGGTTPSEYARYSTTATFPAGQTPTSVTIGNRIAAGAASTGTFQFSMGNATMVGTATSGGFIPTNGERLEIKPVVILAPGTKLAYTIGGSGGGLAAAARCSMTFLFYTVPV